MVFGDGTFGCEYRFRWGPEIGMPYDRNGVLIGIDGKSEYSFFFFFFCICGHSEKKVVHKPRKKSHQEPNLLVPWSWPAELWEINVCCLSQSVHGILLE